jgi:catechol 2,3-dioxygenase-like lactoylglutathione lyase family enzyme
MIERAVAILPGDNIGVARDFYVSKLGFVVEWEASEDGKDGLLGLKRGSIELTIDCPMSGHGRNACISLRVNSADAYYNEWKQQHVEMKRPPADEPWGARTFSVSDPFGNTIFVIGPSSESRDN